MLDVCDACGILAMYLWCVRVCGCGAVSHAPLPLVYCEPYVVINATASTPALFTDGSPASEVYGNSSQCFWLVRGPAGSHLRLTFSRFDLESSMTM